jgi:predicted lipoprotein with Yx(FWY)xxD motif
MNRIALLISAVLLSSTALAADPVKKMGDIYVTDSGMTIYTFDKDTAGSGKSACADACLKNWPAVAAPAGVSGDWSSITRDDGSKQLAYKGKPVYTFAGDKKSGDRNGDGFKDMWRVVK